MKIVLKLGAFIVLAGFLWVLAPAQAADGKGSVTIIYPKNGEELPSNIDIIMKYKFTKGPKGDHVHFFLDDVDVGLRRKKEGKFNMATLTPGRHNITLKLVNAGHVPLGIDTSIMIKIK